MSFFPLTDATHRVMLVDMKTTTNNTQTHFIVQDAAAFMPSSCWGVYRRVAVLEVDAPSKRVAMISTRARGCHRVVKTWERLNVGKTDRCAFNRAYAEAEKLAAELNARAEKSS